MSSQTTPMNPSRQTIAAAARRIRNQWTPAERAKRSQIARKQQQYLLRQLIETSAVA